MDWDKLIAELDERHEQDVYEFVVTVLAIKMASSDGQYTFSGVGAYVSHTPDQIQVELGRTNSATWYGKDLRLDRSNTTHAEIISTKGLVLDVLELINKQSIP